MEMDIVRGTIFIKMEGEMTEKSYMILEKKINQLLYEYGMHSFVFNFSYCLFGFCPCVPAER